MSTDDMCAVAPPAPGQRSQALMGVLTNHKGTNAVRTAVNGKLQFDCVSMPQVDEGYEANGLKIEIEADGMFTITFIGIEADSAPVIAARGSINHRQIELAEGNGSY